MWLLISCQESYYDKYSSVVLLQFYLWKVTLVSSHVFIWSLVQNPAHIRKTTFSYWQTNKLSGCSQPYQKWHFDLFIFKVKQEVQSFGRWETLKIKPEIGTWVSQKYSWYIFPQISGISDFENQSKLGVYDCFVYLTFRSAY